MSGAPHPKSKQLARGQRRYRRKIASPKQWQAIYAAKCRSCRICLAHVALVTVDPHHLVARDHFGDDVPENIIGLCRDCHEHVERRDPFHCRIMLRRLDDAEYAYMTTRGGEDYAERVYRIEYTR